jgi:ssRNA-specific RNase YbeY (16S rRNA maturation enzyme)
LEQIQKLNKFYVESNRRQPEREETLLWVDKLIEFISKTNEIVVNEAKEREQALLSITLHVTQEMKQLNIEYSKSDTVIAAERMKFLE